MFLYRLLLRFYPASFRAEYGAEMCAVFEEKRRRASGLFEVIGLWVQAILDLFRHAIPMHADTLRYDIGYTVRSLYRTPGFALAVIGIAALGIGATTAVFTVVDRVLTRPLAFADPDRVVRIWEAPPGYGQMEASPPNYRDWLDMATSFEMMAAYSRTSANLVSEDDPERIHGAAVAGELFSLLGVPPLLGRHISPEDDIPGTTPTAVLSYGLWQRRFGGDPDILNRSINLDDAPTVIVGVMPADFVFPDQRGELWVPLQLGPSAFEDRNNNFLEVVARLKDNVSLDMARAEMLGIMQRLETLYPEANEQTRANVNRLGDEVPNQARLLLIALMGASLCVLLVACTNLANLLLARAAVRRQELAVRCSLGAGRGRLARQLLTESCTLAGIGGACGVLLAHGMLPLLARLVPQSIPVADTTSIDIRVLAFAVVITAITGVAFGALPALKAGRDAVSNGLRESSRGGGVRGGRIRSLLVIVEVSASVVLLVVSGLLIRTLKEVRAIDPGFKAEGVLTARTWLPWPRYSSTSDRAEFYTRVLNDLRALPNVESAAFTSFLPIVMGGGIWPVEREGTPSIRALTETASLRFVTPGYFSTLGIQMLTGRCVAETDTEDRQNVAVVSQSFVDRYWPGQNPIGRSFGFALSERVVVGVAEDVLVRGLERESEPQVYLPYRQVSDGWLSFYAPKDLAIRTAGDPLMLVPSLREIVHRADPTQPLQDVRLLEEVVADNTASRDTQLRILNVFAALVFLLAAVGIYSLLSFATTNRAREIGVRMALGARKSSIAVMFLRNGLLLGAAGVLTGAVFGYLAGSAMEALLFGIDPMDPLTYTAAISVALIMTVTGSLPPAIRAARLDPVEVIREG